MKESLKAKLAIAKRDLNEKKKIEKEKIRRKKYLSIKRRHET